MPVASHARTLARLLCALAPLAPALLPAPAAATPLTQQEITRLCEQAEGPAHCGQLVEEEQLKRLPYLATRDGRVLKVSLFPSGVATFTDTEALNGGRSYSLWDYLDAINAVVLYTIDGDNVTFTLLQRVNGRTVELPSEPRVSPDRQRLATADFCESRCINELAVWRVARDGVRKEALWKPKETWVDAAVAWRDADTLTVEYTAKGKAKPATLTRRLNDPEWGRLP
jgi:hypothetical protein